jgi:MYXO-CTERM domain-containing protein
LEDRVVRLLLPRRLEAIMRFVFFALLAGAGLIEPRAAHACGGFFCNQSAPVNQAAERIVFARGADGTVTAIIQIQYAGPSERFAWMLPVSGSPEISVSSNSAFAVLQSATNPSYSLQTTVEGECRDTRGGAPIVPIAADASRADAGASGPVGVVDEGSVGPYDYVVVSTDPESDDRVGDAMGWLTDNGYDVSGADGELLRPYLDSGLNLLAFRLTKQNGTGSIRPVRITFGAGLPSIPIRPTAVAATPDMGVMVFMLGETRAVPINYLSLELNEALVNWINPTLNYDDVVTAAANEAGGQGFVTEFAGPVASLGFGLPLADQIYPEWIATQFTDLENADWTDREGELLVSTFFLGGYDGVRDALVETLPLPDGVTVDQYMSCPSCYFEGSTQADIEGFDPVAYVAALRRHVVEPLVETRALFEAHEYLTRLYTTMSADEMTMDPIFDFNPDLGDYSNVHVANRVIECVPSLDLANAPWRAWLPDGQLVRGTGNVWPFSPGVIPANVRTRRIGTSGPGEIVEDNQAPIGAAVARHNATVPSPISGEDDGMCSASAGGTSAAMLGLVLMGVLAIVRRRR